MRDSQIVFSMYQCITLKQLNSWTTIDTFRCLGCLEITYRTKVPEVPGSIPWVWQEFLMCALCFNIVVILRF